MWDDQLMPAPSPGNIDTSTTDEEARSSARRELAAMRDRIIKRFDDKTGSNSAAHFGPLVEAILEELAGEGRTIGRSQEAP